MKINLIVAQYKQAYDGQYMPNVVDAWDEYVMEDNHKGFYDSLCEHEARVNKDYDWVRVLVVEVPDDVVTNLATPPVVKAKVAS
jgi:hypothetical protein